MRLQSECAGVVLKRRATLKFAASEPVQCLLRLVVEHGRSGEMLGAPDLPRPVKAAMARSFHFPSPVAWKSAAYAMAAKHSLKT